MIFSKYFLTQRIPTDPALSLSCNCLVADDSLVQFTGRVESYSAQCISGYTLELSSNLWAGFIPDGNAAESPPSVECPYPSNDAQEVAIHDKLTDTVEKYRNLSSNSLASFEPIDVIPYAGLVRPGGGAPVQCFEVNVSEVVTYMAPGVFSIELCSQGYCRGDSDSRWVLANESFPCTRNRMGPLCGQCMPGYAVTLYSTVSHMQSLVVFCGTDV